MRRSSSHPLVARTLLVLMVAGCAPNPNALPTSGQKNLGGGPGGAGAADGGAATVYDRVTNPTAAGSGSGSGAAGSKTAGSTATAKQDGHSHGPGAEHGLSHKGELTAIQALKDVTPVAVSKVAGYTGTIDGMNIVIPPGALTGDGQLRIRRIDNSERPVLPQKVPGMSFWMEMGGAQVATDQSIKITGPVEDKFIEELKKRDPKFDPNNYNLKQENGKWMLTMSIDGPQTADKAPAIKTNAPYFTTVERADPTTFPVTWFTPQGPMSNTGYKLMGAEGQDHLDGFQTFEDLKIGSIQEYLTDEEAAQDRFKPLDLTKIKTKDANGNPIELDAGSIGADGKWKVATGKSSFNPVTHQQNCDFADAGCPDSGAVAKSLAMFNHVVTTRFPSDYSYPSNMVDANGMPDSRAGTPHPAAGKIKRPPADLLAVVDNYRKLDSACDTSAYKKVWAKCVWKSDVSGVHNTVAVSSGTDSGPFIDFKGLEGQAGGEVTVGGRIRPVDSRGMAFEQLKTIYNITPYYNEPRNKPSGLIVGEKKVGNLPDEKDNEANPIVVYLPRYSPKVQIQLWGEDTVFKSNDQVELKFKIDDGEEQIAKEIIPANENVAGALPGEKVPQLVVGTAAASFKNVAGQDVTVKAENWTQPFEFFAKIQDNFSAPAGKDTARKLTITSVVVKRQDANGKPENVEMAPKVESLAAAKWVPGEPSAGVWLNSRSTAKIQMFNTGVK
ncbi:MAG: hypothetical protein VKP62_13410 [Candidatus Sericytochromatia bacterium]|nr:hypothetical protein [Candidatus Sericytochromatia bacterium]